MPHEIRSTIRLTLRLEDLDVGEIAAADIAAKLISAEIKRLATEHGFGVEIEKPKLVGVRGKGEPEPQATTLDLPIGVGVTGQGAGDALPQNAGVAGDDAGLEIPALLKREGKKS